MPSGNILIYRGYVPAIKQKFKNKTGNKKMFYIAQANIDHEELSVKKGQTVTEEVFNSLPDKLKIKFVPGKVSPIPIGLNQVINVKKTRGK